MQKKIYGSFRNLNKRRIINSFNRAAHQYDKYAFFQRTCGNNLYNFIKSILINDNQYYYILDAGCGTGWFSRKLKKEFRKIIAFDISYNMLECARFEDSADFYILGDIEQLPFRKCSIDLIFSNLAVQWCKDLPLVLNKFYKILKPGGMLALSTLASGSLSELECAWKNIDNYVHINKFLEYEKIHNAFSNYRYKIKKKLYLFYYKEIIDLLREIKGVGASCLWGNKFVGLTSRKKIENLNNFWPKRYCLLPLSYNVVYGILYRD